MSGPARAAPYSQNSNLIPVQILIFSIATLNSGNFAPVGTYLSAFISVFQAVTAYSWTPAAVESAQPSALANQRYINQTATFLILLLFKIRFDCRTFYIDIRKFIIFYN